MDDRPTVLRTGGNLTKWRRGRDLIFAEHIFHFRLCNMPLGYVVSLIFMTTPKDKSFFFFMPYSSYENKFREVKYLSKVTRQVVEERRPEQNDE